MPLTRRMLSLVLLFGFALLVAGQDCEKSWTEVGGERRCRGQVIFEENFDGLDSNKWRHSLQISGEDFEFVTYTVGEGNTRVEGGKLIITPTIQNDRYVREGRLNFTSGCTGKTPLDCAQVAKFAQILPPINSGEICTANSFSFKYGNITIKAKFPSGDWLIPRLTLKPLSASYGPWYMSGKIQVASINGGPLIKPNGEDIGSKYVAGGIILSKNDDFKKPKARFGYLAASEPWSNDYHQYTISWAPDRILFYTDENRDQTAPVYVSNGQRLYNIIDYAYGDNPLWESGDNDAPFDKEFYICIGLAVGGHFGIPDNSVISRGKQTYTKPWENLHIKAMFNFWQAKNLWSPSWSADDIRLLVDSVKVTAL